MVKLIHQFPLTIIGVILSIVSFAISSPTLGLNQLAFCYFLLSILLIFFDYVRAHVTIRQLSIPTRLFWFVLALAFVSRLSLLTSYPFVSVGDQLRDGGLDAQKIVNQEISNLFESGAYNAHGLIIPWFSSLFYLFIGPSVLVYRIPAALISILDIIAIFIFVKSIKGTWSAFFSSLVLIVLPLHLFYGRTELVVIFSSLMATLTLFTVYHFFARPGYPLYILLGLIIGFSWNFHGGVKAFTILVAIFVVTRDLITIVTKLLSKQSIKSNLIGLTLLAGFLIIGFGPKIIFTNQQGFVHASRFNSNNLSLNTLTNNYLKSLMVYFYEPTNSWYPDHQPILVPIFALFFLLGIGKIIFLSKNIFDWFLIYLISLTPFTNSTITDILNADHRLVPLLPVIVIIIGIGIDYILDSISTTSLKRISTITLSLYIILVGIHFFIKRPADINDYVNQKQDLKDYLSMHLIYFLRSQPSFTISPNLCISAPPANYPNYILTHYQEQYQYFFPHTVVGVEENPTLTDSEIMITPSACSSLSPSPKDYQISQIDCSRDNFFTCPHDYLGKMKIYYPLSL